MFVGYQGEGTLGRMLLEGAEHVKLFGVALEVAAENRGGLAGQGRVDVHREVVHGTDKVFLMLTDSAHIQQSDAEYENRKNQRAGRPPVEPLYTVEVIVSQRGKIYNRKMRRDGFLGNFYKEGRRAAKIVKKGIFPYQFCHRYAV